MIFNILNNGGISFKVDVDFDTNNIDVYKVIYDNEYEPHFNDTPTMSLTKVRQIFYGIDPFVWQWDNCKNNLQARVISLLVRISEQKYLIFIEDSVTSFTLPHKTSIQEYHAFVGNSAVSYAFAITNDRKYIDFYYFTLNELPFDSHVYNSDQLNQLQEMALSSLVKHGQKLRHDTVIKID